MTFATHLQVHSWRAPDVLSPPTTRPTKGPPTLHGSGRAHDLDFEASFVLEVSGVVVGAPSAGVAIRIKGAPAVDPP